MQNQNNLNQQLLTARIMWGVLCLSTVMLYLLLNIIAKPLVIEGAPAMDPSFNPMTLPFFLPLTMCAVTALILSIFISNLIFKDEVKSLSEPLDFPKVFPSYFKSLVIRMALSEVPTMVGFILAMTNQQISIYLPFGFASLVFMLMAFPIEDTIIEKAKRLKANSLKLNI